MRFMTLAGALLLFTSSQISAQQPKGQSEESCVLGDERPDERTRTVRSDTSEQMHRKLVDID